MVGLRLEQQGKLHAIIRSPDPRAEFIEDGGSGTRWDVKSFRSLVGGRPAFRLQRAVLRIEEELEEGNNVIVNTAYLSPDDLTALRTAIHGRGWSSRVLYGDSS
jgi:hypothetical protein